MVSGVKDRSLDFASICALTPERKKFMLFSRPITKEQWVIVTRTHFRPIETLEQLIGETLSMTKGYAVVELVKNKYNGFSILESNSPEEGLRAVATGKAAAYVGYLSSVSYQIKNSNLSNLKIASDAGFPTVPLHICIRANAPRLVSMINKSLKSIPMEKKDAIHSKWSPVKIESVSQGFLDIRFIGTVFITALLVFCFLSLAMIRVSRHEGLSRQFGSARFRNGVIATQAGLMLLIVILALWALEENRTKLVENRLSELKTVLKTTTDRLHLWLETEMLNLDHIAESYELNSIVEALLKVPPVANDLRDSPAQKLARRFFLKTHKNFKQGNLTIINENRINLSSGRDEVLGHENLIASQRPDLLTRVFQGETRFVPHIEIASLSGLSGQKEQQTKPAMSVISPIRNQQNNIIGALIATLDPGSSFSQVFHFGQFGMSGESYAFDRAGRLFSESRFNDHLRKIHLIKPGQQSSLNIEIRDPGGNMVTGFRSSIPRKDQPLTRMAGSAIEGNAGEDMEGYRDYRGVLVVGVWRWDHTFDIGMTTEIDWDEALGAYRLMRFTVLIVLSLSLILAFGGTTFTLFLSERASTILRQSRDDLERLVKERTFELTQSEKKFRTFIESTSEAYLLFSDQFMECNQAACHLWEASREEIIGYNPSDFSPEFQPTGVHSSDYLKERLDAALAGQEQVFDWQFLSKKGHTIEVEVILKAIDYKQRRVVLTTFRDITERKRNAQKLHQQNQLLDAIINNVHNIVVYAKDCSGTYLLINDYYEEAVGVSRKEVIGKTDRDFLPGEVAEELRKTDQGIIASGKAIILREDVPHPDGTFHYYQTVKTPLRDLDGSIIGIVGLSTDFTSLHKAKEEVEAAHEAKSVFLASISHELRTPLNAILGFSDLLMQDSKMSQKQQESLVTIHRSGEHLLNMISDLLDFSKIESNSVGLNVTSTNLSALHEEVIFMNREMALSNGTRLNLEQGQDFPYLVVMDGGKLRQVLINLVSNAIKFTENGTVSLRVSGEFHKKHVHLSYEIEDTGVGINQDQLEGIFKPFVQTGSEAQKQKGTGLGLAISQRLIGLLGGTIRVESEIGKGSIFSFDLKVKLGETVISDASAGRTSKIIELREDQSPCRILLVDDSLDHLRLLRKQLEPVGFQIHTASSGKEALEEFELWEPHLIWMDLNMPVMDGLQAADRIRRLSGGENVKILALTTGSKEVDKESVFKAGCDDLCQKPYEIENLLVTMAKHLDISYTYEADFSSEGSIRASTEMDEQESLANTNLLDLHSDFKELAGLLRDSDTRALEVSEAIEERMKDDLQDQRLNKVLKMVKRFEFEESLVILKELADEMKLELDLRS